MAVCRGTECSVLQEANAVLESVCVKGWCDGGGGEKRGGVLDHPRLVKGSRADASLRRVAVGSV